MAVSAGRIARIGAPPRTVWLASYPKSGNTWLRAVYTALKSGAAVDINALSGGCVPAARGHLDTILGVPTSDLTAEEIATLRPRVDEALDAEYDEVHLRKVHDALHLGPNGDPIVSLRAARAVIYLIRDPRDVAVSYAHHACRPIEAIVDLMCRPGATVADPPDGIRAQTPQRIDSWSAHVCSWVDQLEVAGHGGRRGGGHSACPGAGHGGVPVHVVRYEDALRDPVGTFGRALRFAGVPVDDADLATAVERASFRTLAAQESQRGFQERPVPAERFFRSGVAGRWAAELPPALADRLVETHHATMKRFGYIGNIAA